MVQPLMPKATAVWLVESTALTFAQIGEFCGLHSLEVQGIADGEVAQGIKGLDPIVNGQLTAEEIERCSKDPGAELTLLKSDIPEPAKRTKGPRYTPVSKRQDKPDGIAYLLRHFPELTDGQIGRLLGTTKATINAVRERTHWNSANIRPRDPVILGLCKQVDLDEAIRRARKAGRKPAEVQELPPPEAEVAPSSKLPDWMASVTFGRGSG